MLRYVIDIMAVIFFFKKKFLHFFWDTEEIICYLGSAPQILITWSGVWWEARGVQMKQTGPGSDDRWVKGDLGLSFCSLQYIEMFYNKKF